MVADNAPQQVRADVARARYEAWLNLTDPILAPDVDLKPYRTSPAMIERKQRTEAIREAIQNMLLAEQGLRVERAQATRIAIA
ncbi:MAG: hypothetical protein ABJB12_07750 [Pseudomonadota bacterium]